MNSVDDDVGVVEVDEDVSDDVDDDDGDDEKVEACLGLAQPALLTMKIERRAS